MPFGAADPINSRTVDFPTVDSPTVSFLDDAGSVPLLAAETVCAWGKTLVIAPHPDDETLGCGGAIALLASHHVPVSVLFVSDGTKSHPTSQKYPPLRLRDLREREAQQALELLGVPFSPIPNCAWAFMRLPDGAVPDQHTPDDFFEAYSFCRDYIEFHKPHTILLPWRRDPHPDHRAVSQIMQAALAELADKPRVFEYPVWAWERAAPEDLPQPHEARAFRLDIRDVAAAKQAAVAAHQSQVTHLIDDDPHGFWLSPEVLAHFARPWEVYLEVLEW